MRATQIPLVAILALTFSFSAQAQGWGSDSQDEENKAEEKSEGEAPAKEDAKGDDAKAEDAKKDEAAAEESKKDEATSEASTEEGSAEEKPSATEDAAASTSSDSGTATGAGAAAGGTISVAAYELVVRDIDEGQGRLAYGFLVKELRKLQRVNVVPMDEIKDMLDHEAQKALTGCDDESCLSEIAAALGVDQLLVGEVGKAGDQTFLKLNRIDQLAAQNIGSFNERFVPNNGEEFLAAIGPAVEKLFPERPLRPGQERGVSEKMVAVLDPPPLPTWAFWTTAGVAATTLAAGGVTSVFAWQQAATWDSRLTSAAQSGDVIPGRELVDIQEAYSTFRTSTYVLLGLGGGIALAAGVMAPFTDWNDYASQRDQLTAE
jgi:hypothetical protein